MAVGKPVVPCAVHNAELLAAQQGLIEVACNLGAKNIQLEGDFIHTISLISSLQNNHTKLHPLLSDIQISMSKYVSFQAIHVYRGANQLADFIAKYAY